MIGSLMIGLALASAGCQSSSADAARRQVEAELVQRQRQQRKAAELYDEAMIEFVQEQWEPAAKKLREVVAADDRHAAAWMALGIAELRQRHFYEAAEAFHRAARILPDRHEPRFNLGVVFDAAGQYDKAVPEYEAALEHAPNDLQVMENLARAYIRTSKNLDRARQLIEQALARETRPDWLQWLQREKLRLAFQSSAGAVERAEARL